MKKKVVFSLFSFRKFGLTTVRKNKLSVHDKHYKKRSSVVDIIV